jgi:hypothetical protein
MVEGIELAFPALQSKNYVITSPQSDIYNCIAWAAGDTSGWWWPDDPGQPESSKWPVGVQRKDTLEAFREAFVTLGFATCDHDQLETGFEKIALFALAGKPKHAARQLPNGRWTSKLGPMEDIEHSLDDLSGLVYGAVVLVMKRSYQAS